MDAKGPTLRHIITNALKVKDKERILKTVREKQLLTDRGVPTRISTNFSKEAMQARRDLHEIFKSHEKQRPTAKILLPSKDVI